MLSKSGRFAFAILLLILPAVAPAQQIAIGQYPLPDDYGNATGIAAGSDGALWFTEYNGNKIGRITTAGAITVFPVPTAGSSPMSITAGPDGALWFTEATGNQIGRITIAGAITEYPVPTANSGLFGITAGRDGALWFTESAVTQLGRITTAGVITEYPLQPQTGVGAITAGPDGALWFMHGEQIVRMTTPGSFTVYPGLGIVSAIAAGPDGALWLGLDSCRIGRITTAGVTTTYPLPGCTQINGIAAGADGAMWFTEAVGNLGRVTTAGAFTLYPSPGGPGGIAAGPDGELWFTEHGARNIEEAFFVTADLTASPARGFYRTDHTFTGSGFAPNETVRVYMSGVGSAVLATATTDASGSFTVPASEPAAPFGPRVYVGVGQSSHKLGAASFTVTPNLVFNPDSGPAGSSVTAAGYGFPPFREVAIYWGAPRTLAGTAISDVNGTFGGSAALTFTVPAGAAAGANTILGTWVCSTWPPTCPSDSGFGYFTVE
jgi:virginiamycin B lyase